MATGNENVQAAWKSVDDATNALAVRVQTLIDEINKTAAEGLTGPQTEAVLANLTGLAATLTAMGKTDQPIPSAVRPVPIPGPFA